MRRIAAHRVMRGDQLMRLAVVLIEGDRVVGCHPLDGEQAMTEWLGGTIDITDGHAYRDGQLLRE